MTAHAVRYQYHRLADGSLARYTRQYPITYYICNRGSMEPHEQNRYPGRQVDALIWKTMVDAIMDNPDKIINQTVERVKELQAEGDDVNGRITQYQKRLQDLDQQELVYNRQLARGKLNEEKYDILIDELEATRKDIQAELFDLITLRDETGKVQDALAHARAMLAEFGKRIEEINLPEDELLALPVPARKEVLIRRQQIVKALVTRIDLYPDKLVLNGAVGEGVEKSFGCTSTDLLSD